MHSKTKFFLKLTLLFLIILGGYFVFYFLSPQMKQASHYNKNARQLIKEIKEKHKESLQDLYGAPTPEETYQLFLQALQKEDIDLAIKYFVPAKQALYKQFFSEIKKNNKWSAMLNDLLQKKNQKGVYRDKATYVIHVLNSNNVLIAQPVLKQVGHYIGDKNSSKAIWKLTEF